MSENPEISKGAEVKAFNPFQNFTGRLDVEFQCKRVNVEFCCGNCCKKAVGGILTLIGRDFIELTSDCPFEVLTFVPGVAVPFKEWVRAIIIPLDRVCSVERPSSCSKHDDSCKS